MAASGIEIIRGQLEQLKEQRERIYNEQLLPLDDAIASLEKLVGGQNGKVRSVSAKVSAPAETTTNGSTEPKPTKKVAAKSASVSRTKAPAKGGEAPAKSKAPTESKAPVPPASEPETKVEKAKATPAKKPTVRLKSNFRGKSVDEAVVALFSVDPTKTWKTEEVVNAITSPPSKTELNTYIRSLRLSLANGAAQGKWKKLSDGPAVYAPNDYKTTS